MTMLQIECCCTEDQMKVIVDMVEAQLVAQADEVLDIDCELFGFRICVSFSTFLHEVRIELAEVLDADWDLLYEDTAVLNSRLNNLTNDCNIVRYDECSGALAI